MSAAQRTRVFAWAITACVCACTGTLAAQAGETGAIRGYVFDLRTERPLLGVDVVLFDRGQKVLPDATTDASGRFVFLGIPPSSERLYFLQFRKPGYEAEFRRTPICVDQSVLVSVGMREGHTGVVTTPSSCPRWS